MKTEAIQELIDISAKAVSNPNVERVKCIVEAAEAELATLTKPDPLAEIRTAFPLERQVKLPGAERIATVKDHIFDDVPLVGVLFPCQKHVLHYRPDQLRLLDPDLTIGQVERGLVAEIAKVTPDAHWWQVYYWPLIEGVHRWDMKTDEVAVEGATLLECLGALKAKLAPTPAPESAIEAFLNRLNLDGDSNYPSMLKAALKELHQTKTSRP